MAVITNQTLFPYDNTPVGNRVPPLGIDGSTPVRSGDDILRRLMTEVRIAFEVAHANDVAMNAELSPLAAPGGVPEGSIADGAITNRKLGRNAVNADKIANRSITAVKIAENSLTQIELGPNSVGSTELRAASIGAREIATDAVTSVKLRDDSVHREHLESGSVGADEIANDQVLERHIANGNVTSQKIAAAAIQRSHISGNIFPKRYVRIFAASFQNPVTSFVNIPTGTLSIRIEIVAPASQGLGGVYQSIPRGATGISGLRASSWMGAPSNGMLLAASGDRIITTTRSVPSPGIIEYYPRRGSALAGRSTGDKIVYSANSNPETGIAGLDTIYVKAESVNHHSENPHGYVTVEWWI